MTLIALGINHNTAAVDIRERIAFTPGELEQALSEARDQAWMEEIAILSTCNRTEIYCQAQKDSAAILDWLAHLKNVPEPELRQVHYAHHGPEAARHMMSVASGLDSLVLGEPQILGQMKSSYSLAKAKGALGSALHHVFQRVFSVAKRVRSETAIGQNPVSVAYAAVSLAQQIFSDLKQDTALLVGAGETIELVARHLKEQGIKKLMVANRTLENAQILARELDAETFVLADIPNILYRADIVISSTAAPLPILGKGAVESALKKRKHKPMFMVDIAVPRDIEPQVKKLSDVYLYTVDDLKEVIDENKRSRESAADMARDIINVGVEEYAKEQRAYTAVSTIKAFREKVEFYKQQELQKAMKRLQSGEDPATVMDQYGRSVANKFMHHPMIALKRAGVDQDKDLIQHFQQAFDLHVDPEDPQKNT